MSELEQPMDEGDGVALMDPDFPEDTLPEKPTNVVQVETLELLRQIFRSSLMLHRQLSGRFMHGRDVCKNFSPCIVFSY